jgi:hypothetical protein
LKLDLKMRFEKEEKKKQKDPATLSAQTAQPSHPRRPTVSPFSFLFTAAPTGGPHLSASIPSPSFLLPRVRAGRRRTPLNPPGSRLFPFLSFLPEPAN